jgi:hypothetical protein
MISLHTSYFHVLNSIMLGPFYCPQPPSPSDHTRCRDAEYLPEGMEKAGANEGQSREIKKCNRLEYRERQVTW